jgi:hypothetical protein
MVLTRKIRRRNRKKEEQEGGGGGEEVAGATMFCFLRCP